MRDQFISELAGQGMTPAAPIEAVCDVSAPTSDVWKAIAERGNLTNVHPFCATNEVEVWPGVGARDHVRYYSGLHYLRDCLAWVDGVGYDLAVGPPGQKTAWAEWRIEKASDTASRFSIEVISFVRSDMDPDRRQRYVADVIERAIPPYLDGVVRGVAHFVETGTPVGRNRFGAHDIYSP